MKKNGRKQRRLERKIDKRREKKKGAGGRKYCCVGIVYKIVL